MPGLFERSILFVRRKQPARPPRLLMFLGQLGGVYSIRLIIRMKQFLLQIAFQPRVIVHRVFLSLF